MPKQTKRQVKNRLALFRRRRSLELKQVAGLLGHSSTAQISRYENGLKIPTLKTALKLAAIYDIHIRRMLDGYYEACLEEIKKEDKAHEIRKLAISAQAYDVEVCSVEEKLAQGPVSPMTLQHARRHSRDLMRLLAEKLGHFGNANLPNG
jgi:transcriptional regulator with XRE-family HTH domain